VRKLLLILFIAAILVIGYEWATFPDVAPLAKQMPRTTSFMEIRRAELRSQGTSDVIAYTPVPYERISPYLRRAALVAEDNDFYEHSGVDVNAMKEALQRDLKRKRITHGGSTITQQLAKNLYLSPSRNPLRKVKEYFIARSLENHLTKKRILELYLNVVEMGERVYGAEAAARMYFHKSAAALSPSEAALLAGCLPNPRIMNPAAPNKRLRARQKMILARLKRWGYLAEEAVEKAAPPPAPVTQTETTDTSLSEAPAPPPAEETQTTETTTAGEGTGAPLSTETTTTTTTTTSPPP